MLVGVLFAPIGQQGSCADTAASVTGDGQCASSFVPPLGLILPISYPVP